MKIGLDLDNTILDYSQSIKVASMDLYGVALPNLTKGDQKSFLCEQRGEDAWTVLQGHVYGEYSTLASTFPGFGTFLEYVLGRGFEVKIMSHKTTYPFAGPRRNLREFALLNLRRLGVLNEIAHVLPEVEVVNFFETKEEKIRAVNSLGFDFFFDDLFEVAQLVRARVCSFHMFCNVGHDLQGDISCSKDWDSALRTMKRIEKSEPSVGPVLPSD